MKNVACHDGSTPLIIACKRETMLFANDYFYVRLTLTLQMMRVLLHSLLCVNRGKTKLSPCGLKTVQNLVKKTKMAIKH